MTKPLLSLLALSFLTATTLPALEPIPLWLETAPGEPGALPPEQDMSKPTDNAVGGKPLIRLGNVSQPTITVFPAPKDKNTGTAVIVCPGGGYSILALDLEGTEVCQWLNSIGVTGVLLKYRVPKRADRPRFEPPLRGASIPRALASSASPPAGISLPPRARTTKRAPTPPWTTRTNSVADPTSAFSSIPRISR